MFRYGMKQVPLQGVGCIIKNLDVERPLFVLCYQAAQALEEGIALLDLPSFLETPAGSKFFEEASKLVIPPGCFGWCPFGALATPVLCAGDDNLFALFQPVFSIPLAKKMPMAAKAAVESANTSVLKKFAATDAEWQAASELFEVFMSKCR